jgi:enediyne biosynthesis protein E4
MVKRLFFLIALTAGACIGGAGDPGGGPHGDGGGGEGLNPSDGSDGVVQGGPFWSPIDLAGATDLGHTPVLLGESERVAPGAITFADETVAAGLGEVIGGGNQHGVGVAFVDLSGDGRPDLVVINGRGNTNGEQYESVYYRNNGDGTFQDATESSGIGAALRGVDGYSIAAADYDNDGDIDLYVGAQPTDILLRNDGGSFVDMTQAAGAGGPESDPQLVADGRGKVVAWGDFDGDGHLDIASASSTLPDPNAYLLRNQGDGTFVDITAATGMAASPRGNPCAIMWTDYDNDGDADLWIWNDRGDHVLLRNEAGASLTDVTQQADGVAITNPMGIDGADMDHDGDLDYYISNIGAHPLMENQGDGTFVDITRVAGTVGDYGWGLAFEDFNSDSWPDLFVAQEDNRPYFSYQNLARSGRAEFMQRLVSHPSVQNGNAAHNVAAGFADADGDGRTDAVTVNTDGTRITLHRNVTDLGSHRWLDVRIAQTPTTGERGGIGARVGVKTGDLVQFLDITGGSSRASQNELSARFGLGNWSGAEWVVVLWPDGRFLAAVGVEGNQVLTF